MVKAKAGDNVKVHYSGRLEDGTVFDSSRDRKPLEFTIGSGAVIPGFDNAVTGMSVGEKKTVSIPAEEAYGPYREEMVVEFQKSNIPDNISPRVGMALQLQAEDGNILPVRVTAMAEDTITLDANPPLAGKDLTFDMELVEIG